MGTIRKFVQERNEALGSLDEGKIKAYMKKYGCDDIPEPYFWPSIHKARLQIGSLSEEEKEISREWLMEHGYSTEVNYE